ncbi:nucleosome assembly protein 1-like 1-B [Amphibalanus amphitrite]|uniref:nucleosome assembly protein 1-like 1-B n=1 Tax=Amphibalanus amphitrite TaxID=1232801 RepID=UPI001C90C720|nr:nucleosome assembly protein 1-like 1-B [Amphibalanus amphitrite]XP_043192037.1 nucleosome assembly protein 1-like 1-B [Amphibalanus amphitrite]XP_043192045.1 nucleosome assembly protein 1-like 1-B [Amphibalanus amphitrite]XP_043192050.1 nucleosome assembly protein 1-like 1-B [Amphibalanus amphitrite]XP_043192053.1 nucleosome assembly protein 1-like 1-B [Amphibalanus amphitrite]XP_043192058.1 nucleosome assembly protein 1-like 1-B [Amphibalanus amphitrite]XP_043192068.1 nucleosome assembly 
MSNQEDPEKALETMDEGSGEAGNVTAQLMRNPQVLAALQGRLDGMVGSPSGYIESLPKVVKRRIKALKNLQLKATNIEAAFYEEVHALECKYHKLYVPLYEQRNTIIGGDYEPTDAECEFTLDDEISQEMEDKAKIGDGDAKLHDMDENTKGIPEFWLTVCKNVDLLSEMIQEHDEPILKHLRDIKVNFAESPMGFTLEFHFSPNEHFTNTVLTKEYFMKCKPDEREPFSFEGPEIYKCKGCTIDWQKGKNITLKTIKKKQKHKSRGSTRTITKTVQNDSFFNFFSPPAVPDDPDADVDEEVQAQLTADFEIGHYIRERIVPRAVLYFTGEALEEDDYDDEEEEEEDGEEGSDDDMDDEEDPDFDPKKVKGPKGKGGDPQECKQQ